MSSLPGACQGCMHLYRSLSKSQIACNLPLQASIPSSHTEWLEKRCSLCVLVDAHVVRHSQLEESCVKGLYCALVAGVAHRRRSEPLCNV